MKYFKRLKLWKDSSRDKNIFDPAICEGRSYRWWIYIKKINGRVVFNNYTYSSTTSKHQSDGGYLLRQLGITVDLYISLSGGLQTFESEALPTLYREINDLKLAMLHGKAESNKNRAECIKELEAKIEYIKGMGISISQKELKEIKEEYIREVEKMEQRDKERKEELRIIRQKQKEIIDNGLMVAA